MCKYYEVILFVYACMRHMVTIYRHHDSYELDLSGGDVNSMVIGSWSQVLHQVGPEFLKRMDQLDCDADSERKLKLDTNTPPAIKLQINAGGGSFPLHYDNVSMMLNHYSASDDGTINLVASIYQSPDLPISAD